MRLCISLALVVLVVQSGVYAQGEAIQLTNPSFEDMPRHSKTPRGWYDCGFDGESPPDIQPSGTFSVVKEAQDGGTYLGMVVRDNDTWEAVSQRLSRPMEKGQCYEFSIFLCRSELYVSTSRITDETANYTTPAKLRIYGGYGYCDKQYMLGETSPITSTRWLEYKFKFEPIANYSYIVFEVFYKTPTLFPYNGNVLIDHASALLPIPCDDQPVAREEIKPQPEAPSTAPAEIARTENTQPRGPTVAPRNDNPPRTTPEDRTPSRDDSAVTFSRLKRTDLREGQSIRVDKLFFEVDKSVITTDSYETLNDIYQFMVKNDDVVIEVGGHTNGLCTDSYCDKLSTDRARSVATYLAQRGIPWDRLKYKGYGKRKPIAANDTDDGRRRNQRVEIKIISIDG